MTDEPRNTTDDSGLLRRIGRLGFWTVRAFINDNVPRLGAAIAFYTTIAVAPLLVLTLALAGLFFEKNEARERVFEQVEQLAGPRAVEAIESIEPPDARGANTLATSVGAVALVFGALRVFRQLQDALNEIWRVPPPSDKGWRNFLKRHLLSFGLVVATGFILLVSLVVSAGLSWVAQQQVLSELPLFWSRLVNIALSFAVITFLFATLFKLLPNAPVGWRDVWLGAAVTAVLFNLGKYALGLYLARATIASSYGVAGSLITLLLWTYYAAQIALLGAEFTRIENASAGGRREPSAAGAPVQAA